MTMMTTTVEQVPAREWRSWTEANDAAILDVREPFEFATGSLPSAQIVPLASIPSRLADLDPESPILVICRTGNRSDHAARFLAHAGFDKVANMAGGLVQLGLA